MIHELNSWGGQDRSVLEICKHLDKHLEILVHSYQIATKNKWKNLQHIIYRRLPIKPMIVQFAHYHVMSLFRANKGKPQLIQSTGTAYLRPQVIQVQFIHKSWRLKQAVLPLMPQSLIKRLYHKVLSRYNIFWEHRVYQPHRHYIAISHSIKNELKKHFKIPQQNISLIHHGVDPNHFHPASTNEQSMALGLNVREKLGIPREKKVLLHVGALNERKGLSLSLKALKKLSEKNNTDFHYVAVGGGNPEPYKLWCKENNIADFVTFAPHTKDIREYYWMSDAFLFPSLYEPFGLVILEAMSCGLPVITSKTCGASELITNGETGFLLNDTTDIEEISKKIEFLNNETLIRKVSLAARKTAQLNSWESVANKYRSVYEELIKRL